MPRGADPRLDGPSSRLYREFDTEDLVRIIGWMRDIGENKFSVEQVRAISDMTTGGNRWGSQRVRRVLRVGVDLGWMRDLGRGWFEITRDAVATLSPSLPIATEIARKRGTDPAVVLENWRRQLKAEFKRIRET